MQNFCTFETAQRLADAGFPQPEKEVGQFWLMPTGKVIAISLFAGEYEYLGLGISCDIFPKEPIFLPGVADLLQFLGPATALRHIAGRESDESYMVTTPIASFFGKTAIEALAKAWLFINEGNPADRDEF